MYIKKLLSGKKAVFNITIRKKLVSYCSELGFCRNWHRCIQLRISVVGFHRASPSTSL